MKPSTRQPLVLLAFATFGWAFCAAIMGALPPLVGMDTALMVHLIAGPSGFAALALLYHRRVAKYAPLTVAIVFVAWVVLVDFVFVGLVILRSLEMFRSPIGTWLPFTSIFVLSWTAGVWVRRTPATRSSVRGRAV